MKYTNGKAIPLPEKRFRLLRNKKGNVKNRIPNGFFPLILPPSSLE